MAIKLTLEKTERILFCGSKWWGDPDMLFESEIDQTVDIAGPLDRLLIKDGHTLAIELGEDHT